MKKLLLPIIQLLYTSFFINPAVSQNNSYTVLTLTGVKESYKLSGLNLKALSGKILYKKAPQEDMYLYVLRPANQSKKALPAIIYFTGGGWVDGAVEYQIANAAWFRDNGIIGITADYRVKNRHGTSPLECIEDAKSAVRFVRKHAKELGVNPQKIIVAGGSAGGHIAACTFLDGGDAPDEDLKISTKPNALVLHNPVLGEGFGKDFFEAHPEFSPILNVKKGWPPTILSNGTEDETTPYQIAERFTGMMKNAGNSCELITVKNAGHSCDWPVSNQNFLPTLTEMTRFLVNQKFIEKKKVIFQPVAPDSLFPPAEYAPGYVIEWSKNHYREKIAEFRTKPVGSEKIVMVGNSLTEGGGDWATRLGNNFVVNRGISGDVTEGVLMRIGEVCFYKPKSIFLLIGINDINGGDKTPDETTGNILKIVNKINKLSPETRVFVQSLLPTVHELIKSKIIDINEKLKSGTETNRYTFIDIYSGFVDDNNLMKKEFTSDGLHLNSAGYQQWANLLSEFIPKAKN